MEARFSFLRVKSKLRDSAGLPQARFVTTLGTIKQIAHRYLFENAPPSH
jgi:hypothetical protein